MTSKTSFFNKGIYKSTVKRYAWGSALYFVILFISTVLSLFLSADETFGHHPKDYFYDYPVILHGHYIVIPVLTAFVVPVIVAVMAFRFIHSPTQAIFTHSLPVSRKANYISTLLASLTLMLIPVLSNGIFMALMTFSHYGNYFTVADCIQWTGYTSLALFMMFSCAVFSAMLTGNSFSVFVLFIILHSFLFVAAASFSTMADLFIFGYSENNIMFEYVEKTSFAINVWGFTSEFFRDDFIIQDFIIFVAVSLVLYLCSYILYKKRNIENSGNIAGYRVMNHILKYLVTFFGTMIGFTIFSYYAYHKLAVFATIITLISLVIYTASEMLLKKTVNVLYSWKGYVGFAIFFVIITSVFALSSFFGYETKVPDINEVQSAVLYNRYFDEGEPFTDDTEAIREIINIHSEFVSDGNIPLISSDYNYRDSSVINIKYKLKNGKSLIRKYSMPTEREEAYMDRMFEHESYKYVYENLDDDGKKIFEIQIDSKENDAFASPKTLIQTQDPNDIDEVLKLLKSDIKTLSYSQIYDNTIYEKRYDHIISENNSNSYSLTISYNVSDENGYVRVNRIFVDITPLYKNMVNWINKNVSPSTQTP